MSKTQPFDLHTTEYENWFTKNRPAYESELEAVRRFLPEEGIGLEIGVGTGLFAGPLGITFGVDPSASMRKVARQRGIRVSAGVAEELPIAGESLDFLLMVTVICFFRDVEKAFREAWRVLKPGGTVVIAFIDRDSPLGEKYDQGKMETMFYKDAVFRSAEEVSSLLGGAGFGGLAFAQTIFAHHRDSDERQPVREGHGDGVFAVVKGQKKTDAEKGRRGDAGKNP